MTHTVLVVEDEQDLRDMMRDALELSGYSVITASNGQEALSKLASIDDLAGREVYIRESSSFAEHIRRLNERFKVEGKPPVTILPAPEVLEVGDILEMVNAGLVPATVVDSYMADLYTQVFPNLRRHEGIASPPLSGSMSANSSPSGIGNDVPVRPASALVMKDVQIGSAA